MSSRRITTFEAFWPYYVSQHLTASCRNWHFFGTTLFIVCVLALIVTWNPWFLPVSIVSGYGPAWIGHFFVEHNRPATFTYPVFSLMADFVMYGKMWTGQMDAEVTRIANPG